MQDYVGQVQLPELRDKGLLRFAESVFSYYQNRQIYSF